MAEVLNLPNLLSFTSTKVQLLTQVRVSGSARSGRGTQYTQFTQFTQLYWYKSTTTDASAGERERAQWRGYSSRYSALLSFTGTNVQILTQKARQGSGGRGASEQGVGGEAAGGAARGTFVPVKLSKAE